MRVERSVTFPGATHAARGMAKARWLDANATLDARLPLVRDMCRIFVKAYGSNDQEKVARGFQRFVRDGIRYVVDGPGEELSDSEQTIRKAAGDCDDKARLFVALNRSAKIEARILPVFRGDDFSHVQAEVLLNLREPGTKNAYRQLWVPAELIVRDVELGQFIPRGTIILA